jgi:type II secretory pathway component PulJ
MTIRAHEGSTLIEVLVATLVLVSGVLGVAQLFLTAAATNAASRDATITANLAAQKMEQLLSSDLSDVTTLVDHIDGWGRVLGTGESAPSDAVFTRRWSIEPFSEDAVTILVRVGRTDRSGASGRMPAETRVLTITLRRSS